MQEKAKRLRWQCRRGMLELDLLLFAFFDKYYFYLDASEQALFEHLLTYSDRTLYAYLIKRFPVPNKPLQSLIKQILYEE